MPHLVPPGATERFVELPEGSVRVLTGGPPDAAPPLVLVHGGGTDSAGISWFRTFGTLGHEHHVVALDLPGFGGSREIVPVGGPGPLADVVVRVAEELDIDRAVVFGVSMGGDVALNVALRHPTFVAGLVLIAPGGLAERVGGRVTHRLAWASARLPDALLLPLARFANRFTRSALRAIVHDPATLPSEVVEEFVREARAPDAGIAYGRYNQATLGRTRLRNDVLPWVHEITAPTLFFHGGLDPLVAPSGSIEAAARMPAARAVVVPATGHWAQLEAHELFTREVRGFLAGLAR